MNKKNYYTKKSGSKTSMVQTVPKRRGRRPKKIIEKVEMDPKIINSEDRETQDDSAVILRLKIQPDRLKNLKKMQEAKEKEKEEDNYQPESDHEDSESSSENMFKNDIPNDQLCHQCNDNKKVIATLKTKLEKYEKKEKYDNSNKIYRNKMDFISYRTGKKIRIKKTNNKCWWDCHQFTNLPCFLPELFHDNTYHVVGCFCSFNCVLAYNLYFLKDSKIHHRKSLIYKLYREMYALSPDDIIDIKEAPPKEILEDFGGDVDIDSYRKKFHVLHKKYIVYIPPVRPINIMIEERNIEKNNDYHDHEYVLRRSKPLSKKKSIITTMNINMNNN